MRTPTKDEVMNVTRSPGTTNTLNKDDVVNSHGGRGSVNSGPEFCPSLREWIPPPTLDPELVDGGVARPRR
jgi:hypothetical protein